MSTIVPQPTNCEWCGESLEEEGSPNCKELCTDCTGEAEYWGDCEWCRTPEILHRYGLSTYLCLPCGEDYDRGVEV